MTERGRYGWGRDLRKRREAEVGEVIVRRVHCPSCGAWLVAVDQSGKLYDVRRGVDYRSKGGSAQRIATATAPDRVADCLDNALDVIDSMDEHDSRRALALVMWHCARAVCTALGGMTVRVQCRRCDKRWRLEIGKTTEISPL